ncbi:hypothetical protein HPB49_017727 [Dermacentor silvarum]|uniref:Uncharacterized protein n=1 Tax=Dermacentor silvarum TaxID=543639 RepID=A0ACB8CAQ6_DERSI|nr:hypothetical protein HPB49_017727 [Dermacentor silvarum]
MADAPEVPSGGARALFESCVNSRQCRRSNPLLRCVDSVCLCPRPHVLTPDARCSAPPRGSSEAPGVLTLHGVPGVHRARRLGLPLPTEGERRPLATTVCLFREYTTVSSATHVGTRCIWRAQRPGRRAAIVDKRRSLGRRRRVADRDRGTVVVSGDGGMTTRLKAPGGARH